MLCLAFDCSSSSMSIAVVENTKILAQKNHFTPAKHSELLVIEIQNLLKKLNLNFNDLNLVACTNGPGSFTAIRVALSALKMIKIATNLPAIAISSFEIFANKYISNKSTLINVLIKANSLEAYYAKYHINDLNLRQNNHAKIIKIEELPLFYNANELWCGVFEYDFANFKLALADKILASEVAIYAIKKFLNNDYNYKIEPIYLLEPSISIRKK